MISGFALCACAIAMSNFIYYFDIYEKINHNTKTDEYIDPIEIFAVVIYFVGACIGSLTCGTYKYTWPARRSNVSDNIQQKTNLPI